MAGDAKGEYRGLAYRNDAELQAWLARRPKEAALEAELPIIDPHHHFWDAPQRGRYLLPELLADIGGGHNIVSTVFLECRSMYKKDGPAEMASVGEVDSIRQLRVVLPRFEAEPQLRELRKALAEFRLAHQMRRHDARRVFLDRFVFVPRHAVPNAAEAPAAHSDLGFEHIAHAGAERQVGVADNPFSDAARAIPA